MEAVVLAAGEGTRLEPLTNVRPKPMLPIANTPLLEYVVGAIADAGIEEVVLVVGYQRERIQSHFGDGNDWNVDITYAVQETQRGTGDAILQAEPYIGGDFLAFNGDRIIEPGLITTVIERRAETGDTLMAITRVDEPELYGVVEVEDETITAIHEKPPAHAVASDLINAGVYAFGPEVFAAIRRTETHGELAITKILQRHLDSQPVRPVPYAGRWLDVTRPWDVLTVTGRVLDGHDHPPPRSASATPSVTVGDAVSVAENAAIQPGARILRGTSIGENVAVGANAVLENATVLSDTTIGAGAILRDCVVGANATVGPNTTVEGGDADVALGDRIHRNVRFGGIVGDNATVGGSVTVEPGTILGNDAAVDGGVRISGRVRPGTRVGRG